MTQFMVEVTENIISIIPRRGGIPLDMFGLITKMVNELGYKWWLPGDERGAWRFAKVLTSDLEIECKMALQSK